MFDNPKKELERLQEQLLAAEAAPAAEDAFSDEIYDAFEEEEIYDVASHQEFYRRSAGFDIPDGTYEMDTDRYVPAPKKKGIGGLLLIAFLELLLALALIAWWLGWLG